MNNSFLFNYKQKARTVFENVWVQSFFLNLIFIGIINALFYSKLHFDDAVMASIIYGGYGYYSSNIFFINIVFAKTMVKLLKWLPMVPWYGVFAYGTSFVSMTIITAFVLRKDNKKIRMILWALALFFFSYALYYDVQFTKNATVASLAGALLIYNAIFADLKHPIVASMLGCVMSAIGIMWRSNPFQVVFILVLVVPFVYVCEHWNEKKELLRKLLLYFGVYAFLWIVFWGLRTYHSNYYYDSGWENYMNYTSKRSSLLDYGFPDYEENKELYDALGISESDVELFQTSDFGDNNIWGVDALTQLVGVKEAATIKERLLEFFKSYPKIFLKYDFFYPVLLIFIFSLNLGGKKRVLTETLYMFFAVTTLEFYVYYKGRGFLGRVDFIFLITICAILMLQDWKETEGTSKTLVALVASLAILTSQYPEYDSYFNMSAETVADYNEDIEDISSNVPALYCMDQVTKNSYECRTASVFSVPAIGIYGNCIRIGGWNFNTPDVLKIMTERGVTNVYSDSINNSNLFFVSNDSEKVKMIVNYIRRHYDTNAKAVKVLKLSKSNVYQIITKKPKINYEDAIDSDSMVANITEIGINEDGKLKIYGEAFVPGTNSLAENLYITVTDISAEKTRKFYTTRYQYGDNLLEEGKYGHFFSSLTKYSLEDVENLQFDAYVVVDGVTYHKMFTVKDDAVTNLLLE